MGDTFWPLLQAMADLLTMAGNAFETGLKNTGQAVQNLGNRIGAGVGGSSCSCDENGCGCGGAKCGCFHGGQCTCCGTQCPGSAPDSGAASSAQLSRRFRPLFSSSDSEN